MLSVTGYQSASVVRLDFPSRRNFPSPLFPNPSIPCWALKGYSSGLSKARGAGPRLLISSSLMRIPYAQGFWFLILLSVHVSCPLTCDRGSKVECRVISSCRTWASMENSGCFIIELQLVFSLLCSGSLACFIAVSGKSIFLLPATKQYMCS